MAPTDLTVTAMWETDADYRYMDELRTEHYPPERLFNGAHISLFARLTVPRHRRVQVMDDLRQVAALQKPFDFKFKNKPSLWGKIVVVQIDSRPLAQVRSALNKKFTNTIQCSLHVLTFCHLRWAHSGMIDRNERGRYAPHVTVHARISKQKASDVFDAVEQSFATRIQVKGRPHGKVVGVQLLEYMEDEPYRLIAEFPFST